jgi:hypothetical protein
VSAFPWFLVAFGCAAIPVGISVGWPAWVALGVLSLVAAMALVAAGGRTPRG